VGIAARWAPAENGTEAGWVGYLGFLRTAHRQRRQQRERETVAAALTVGAEEESGRCGGGSVPGRGEAEPCSTGSVM
jgi:hypothetical protein